jgi:CBS domain containing-hemolysin-like protein
LRVFYLATTPLAHLFDGLGNLVLRPFGIPPAREVGHAPHSEGELLELLAENREHGLIETRIRSWPSAASLCRPPGA